MSLEEFQPHYLNLEVRDGVTIATFRMAQLTDDENIERIGQELFALTDQYGCDKIVLNVAPVEYATSSVLGKMITLHRKLHRQDGRLVVSGVHGVFDDILRSSRLITYFHICDDVDQALEQFSASE